LIGWEYMTKSAAVVPFSKGTIAYRDGMLSRLYYGTKEAGLLSVTMCGDEGTEQEIATPVGYCWVDKSHGVDGQRAALIGFCFFKRTRQLRALGLLGIYYWVNALKIDVLHGVMLETNFPAQDYAVKLGFKMSGHVRDYHFHNGHLEGAVVVTLRARDFLPTFKSWYEQNRVAKAD
jgi:hypothetical protein